MNRAAVPPVVRSDRIEGVLAVRRTIAVISLLVLTVLTAPPAWAATVSTGEYFFSPNPIKVAEGGSVSWDNNGSVTHTSTQNSPLSLWNTGNIAPGNPSAAITIRAAGSYAYHCAIHPTLMKGTVKVPIQISPSMGSTSTTFTITLTSATQSGFTYDVQMKVGSGSFTTWKTRVTTRTVTFRGAAGTYAFRSRLHETSNGATSGYSPAKTIKIS
jgi:plastocyanin